MTISARSLGRHRSMYARWPGMYRSSYFARIPAVASVSRVSRVSRFRDGTTGEVDLASALTGPVFAPLKDTAFFRQFTIDQEFHTLVWPNGADIAPEYLHDQVRVAEY